MEKGAHINKVSKYNFYSEDGKLLGLTDTITLPTVKLVTEEAVVPGGTTEVPIPGQFEAMELEVPFQSLFAQIYDVFTPHRSQTFILRAANQTINGAGNITQVGTRAVLRGIPHTLSPGEYKNGQGTNASVTLSIQYFKLEENGEEMIEVDVMNGIYRLHGKDMMSTIDALC